MPFMMDAMINAKVHVVILDLADKQEVDKSCIGYK